MKKSNLNLSKSFIAVSEKRVISFTPPAYGILMRNIFTGDYAIAENSRVVLISFEQAENLLKTYF